MKNELFSAFLSCTGNGPKASACTRSWRLPCSHLTHHTQNSANHIHKQKGLPKIIHDVEKQFGTFQRSRAGRKDWIGIGGCKGQKNQNNETEQSPSHVNLADLAVVRHPFSAGDPQCLDTAEGNTDQCTDQVNSLSVNFSPGLRRRWNPVLPGWPRSSAPCEGWTKPSRQRRSTGAQDKTGCLPVLRSRWSGKLPQTAVHLPFSSFCAWFLSFV